MSEDAGEVVQVPEMPKSSKKPLIVGVLVGGLAFVVVAGAVLWWSGQIGGNNSPITSPGFNTYSKYGFTFEYPKGMLLSEQGMLESTATNSSGMILGTLEDDGYEGVMVGWLTTVMVPDLEVSLNAGFENMVAQGNIAVDKGQLVSSTKAGEILKYQYFDAIIAGETIHGIFGVWYDDANDRFYELMLMQSKNDSLPKFQQYLDSFVG